jgi:hypothetical protein
MFTDPELEVNVVLAQVVLAELNVTPAGNVSLSVAPVMFALLELLRVMVRVDVSGTGPPVTLMLLGLKALTSVGGTATEHTAGVMRLLSIVTAPPPPGSSPARALPATFASVRRLMLVNARILPMNEVVVPRVAELPTCQKTLHA